jgi:hypothetical protein
MLPIRLETHRWPQGFWLNDDNPDRPQALIARGAPEPLVIESVDLETPVFIRFINCESDADYVRFVDRFCDRMTVSLPELRRDAEQLRTAAVETLSADPEREPHADLFVTPLGEARLRPTIRRVDGASRLVLSALTTVSFMALEVAVALDIGAIITACQHCKQHFLYGPHTGRRSHGKFCSDRCRVAASRVRAQAKGTSK